LQQLLLGWINTADSMEVCLGSAPYYKPFIIDLAITVINADFLCISVFCVVLIGSASSYNNGTHPVELWWNVED
jgi:hypothetical protein